MRPTSTTLFSPLSVFTAPPELQWRPLPIVVQETRVVSSGFISTPSTEILKKEENKNTAKI